MRCKSWQFTALIIVLAKVCQLDGHPPPQLSFSVSGDLITLSWLDTNNWLQVSPAFQPSAWVNVPGQPVVTGTTNSLVAAESEPAAFYRLVYSPFLPPPTELAVRAEAGSSKNACFLVSWDAVSNAASYNLYFATDPGVTQFNYLSLSNGAVMTGLADTTGDASNLAVGRTYYFVATAINGTNQSADSAEASAVAGGQSVSGEVIGYKLVGPPYVFKPAPLAGASITLSNLNNPAIVSRTLTDQNGDYELDDEPPGSYEFSAAAQGFYTYTDTIVISNQPVVYNVTFPRPLFR